MSDTSKILATKFTDDRFPIEWKDEQEKSLMWFYDDLHCPNPISPLYFDVGGWWDCDGRWGSDCTYMYQRFGAPIGKAWIAKNIGGYVYSAVVPPEMDADKIGPMFDYYVKVMPIYADTFLDRWHKMYIPRLKEIQNAMLDCDFEHKSLPEIMIHMEDMLDMKSEAFRIHWIINLAQFQASTDFTNAAKAAGADDVLIGKINVSPADRNWDSLKALWEMKEEVCRVPALKELFLSTTDNAEIMAKVADVPGSEKFLEMMEAYRTEYGFKAMYTHEFIYKTWYEDPTPAYEAVRTYVNNNYDYNAEYKSLWGYPQKFEAEQKEQAEKTEISKTVLKGIPGCPGIQEGIAHLVYDPCIDGWFKTEVKQMGQFEAAYQSYHSMMNFFGMNQLLSGGDGLVMPIIDEEDRRQARGAFCAKYAAGRPYFMVRAKTPQLVLDEIDKLMEQLGMN